MLPNPNVEKTLNRMEYTIIITLLIVLFLVSLREEEIIKKLKKMYNCFDIAKYFLKLAKEENTGVDPMKLLKLTYIAHGWHLGITGNPLFSNQVQAWKYGSVIPDLYQAVRMFGKNNVDPFLIDISAKNEIDEEHRDFLKKIWNKYKHLSGLQLSALTHEKDSPWEKTWDGTHNVVIENSIIKDYYKQKLSA